MPKVKTHQGTSKRIRRTKSGKLMHRATGQGHFNSRSTGNQTKAKRRDNDLNDDNNAINRLIPYK